MGEYFLEKFKTRLNQSEYNDIDPTLADMMIESIQKEYNSLYASSSWNDISVQVNAHYDDAEGNQHLTWNDKGYKTAFDYITVRCCIRKLLQFNFRSSFLEKTPTTCRVFKC